MAELAELRLLFERSHLLILTDQALRHHHSQRQLLHDELGANPSAETILLYERLRRGEDI